jgi:hypothetical protein
MGLGLGENVGPVYWHIVETSWSSILSKRPGEWPDPVPCEIQSAELGNVLGISRQHVYDALRWLVASRMVIKTTEGYWVNKNVEEWIHPRTECALVGGKKLAYAASARTRTQKPVKQPLTDPEPDKTYRENGTDRTGETVQRTDQTVRSLDDKVPVERYDRTGETVRPYRENGTAHTILERAAEDSQKISEDQTDNRSSSLKLVRAEDAEPFEAGAVEPETPNLEGHAETVTLAKELFGEPFAAVIRKKGWDIQAKLLGRHVDGIPAQFACFRAALRSMKATLKIPGAKPIEKPYPYALKVARGLAEAGFEEEEVRLEPPPKKPEPVPSYMRRHVVDPEVRARRLAAERRAANP